jgi:hypothetical protein
MRSLLQVSVGVSRLAKKLSQEVQVS